MKETSFKLDQKDNYQANFGKVYRSSATFYYSKSSKKNLKTVISLFNYWKVKNGMEVTLLANLRSLNGDLIQREEIKFTDSNVINYQPSIEDDLEGSLEIEVFSIENMRFPYPAIMVAYESDNAFTMTHTYARNYSHHEIEDKKTIPIAEEAGWTLRDSENIKSFCVFHNGPVPVAKQNVKINIKRIKDDEQLQIEVPIHELNPYETIKLYPQDHDRNLVNFLEGEIGNASISFQLGQSFSRLMVGNERISDGQFQITHSNFNYSKISTNIIGANDPTVVYVPPKINDNPMNVIIYPDNTEGNYTALSKEQEVNFDSLELVKLNAKPLSKFNFKRKQYGFPSRLVLGIEFHEKSDALVSECSLNVFHEEKMKKRFHWGNLIDNSRYNSKLLFTQLTGLYNEISEEDFIVLRFYNNSSIQYIERKYTGADYHRLEKEGFSIKGDSEVEDFLNGEMGWWSIFSSNFSLYPYIYVHDTKSGSAVIEHAF